MRISDWSSDVCSSDLKLGMRIVLDRRQEGFGGAVRIDAVTAQSSAAERGIALDHHQPRDGEIGQQPALGRCIKQRGARRTAADHEQRGDGRSEEHTSELQSLMRISYAVFCLKKKNRTPVTTAYTD